MPTHFLFPNIFPKNKFWNTEGLLYEMFRYCEMKPFRRTIVTTAPFLIFNFFRFQKDLEHRKVPLRKVSVLWDRKSRRRIVTPTHFFSLTFFDIKKFLKHRRVPLRTVSVLWDEIISTHNRHDRPLSYPYYFSISKRFGTQKGPSTKSFGTMRPKM